MSRWWMARVMTVLCGMGIGVSPGLAQWQGPPDRGLQVPPHMQKSIIQEHTPTFHIGPVAASGNGFQPCTALSGYSSENVIVYCATGTVTIKQTSSMVNLAGKKVQLFVSYSSLSPNPENIAGNVWSPGTATSELAFQTKDTVTFGNVPFGSGSTTKPGSVKGKDAAWFAQRLKDELSTINNASLNPRPVKFEVKYGGKTNATLDCGFKAPSTITCQGSPSDPVTGPAGPPKDQIPAGRGR